MTNIHAENAEAEDLSNLTSKRVLVNPSDEILAKFAEQTCTDLGQKGEILMSLGVGTEGDDGLTCDEANKAEKNLNIVAEKLGCSLKMLRSKAIGRGVESRDYLLRKRLEDENDFSEIRVAVVGNVDAGKSTLLGVLTHNTLDDGRGMARGKIVRLKHEIESGRTSSVGSQILGFDSEGNTVNTAKHHGDLDWVEICQKSSKIVTFSDLAGHEKYLKTTVFGLTGTAPDFCLIVVGSNAGAIGMAKEHLGLALALNLPVMCVVTKIDMTPAHVLKETLSNLAKLLKSSGVRKIPLLVQEQKHAVIAAQNFCSERVAPIFRVSSVTGDGIDLLKSFLNLLQPRPTLGDINDPAEYTVDEIFSVPGVGTVVSGTLIAGQVHTGDSLNLGPDSNGKFNKVQIKSIERNRLPVSEVKAGQRAAFALKKIKRKEVRKGSVLLGIVADPPKAVLKFKAELVVLHHPTTIQKNYQAMVHAGTVRQAAQIVGMTENEALRTGDRAIVELKFVKKPEWIVAGRPFVFREGRTKAVGTIHSLIYDQEKNGKSKSKQKFKPQT